MNVSREIHARIIALNHQLPKAGMFWIRTKTRINPTNQLVAIATTFQARARGLAGRPTRR